MSAPNGARARLSCVVITKDEAGRISPLLESIQWADQLVVVDDQSRDETVAICRRAGAMIVSRASGGDFDAQRNAGIDAATGDWVLQLDADEVVSAALRREIEAVLTAQSGPEAYSMIRRNHFLGQAMRHGGWAGLRMVKLFRRGHARYVGRSVHETLEVHGTIGALQQPIDHYPFQSVAQFITRQNFYTSVEAQLLSGDRRTLSQLAIRRPMKIFWKIVVKKGGWRDGFHGWMFAALFAFVEFMKYAKAWERAAASEPA